MAPQTKKALLIGAALVGGYVVLLGKSDPLHVMPNSDPAPVVNPAPDLPAPAPAPSPKPKRPNCPR